MQATTGCKINVSPASGQDFEREIGLVGSRDSIERAKIAITEKVHAVVSLPSLFVSLNSNHSSDSFLTLSHSKRRIAAVAGPQIIKSSTAPTSTSPNPSSSISSSRMVTNRTPSNNSPAHRVEERIPMQRMAAMRTMSLCGILAIKPRIKASKTPKPKVPQARDVMRDIDLRDIRPRCEKQCVKR